MMERTQVLIDSRGVQHLMRLRDPAPGLVAYCGHEDDGMKLGSLGPSWWDPRAKRIGFDLCLDCFVLP